VKDLRALHVLQRLKSAQSFTRGDWIELEQEVHCLPREPSIRRRDASPVQAAPLNQSAKPFVAQTSGDRFADIRMES